MLRRRLAALAAMMPKGTEGFVPQAQLRKRIATMVLAPEPLSNFVPPYPIKYPN